MSKYHKTKQDFILLQWLISENKINQARVIWRGKQSLDKSLWINSLLEQTNR